MANWNDPRGSRTDFNAAPGGQSDGSSQGQSAGQGFGSLNQAQDSVTYDEGLRKHMLSVYNYMGLGVMLTGIVAKVFAATGMATQMMTGGLFTWIIMLAPLGFVLAMSFGAGKFSASTLQFMFWGYALTMGLSLSSIFLVYTGASVAVTFFAAAAAFSGLSLWGYTTKKDISGWGSFLIMGVIGLIVASVANMLIMQSTGFELVVSAIGVLIFSALTAYYTQGIKDEYFAVRGYEELQRKAVILGALRLYIAFINIFLYLLRFLGSRE